MALQQMISRQRLQRIVGQQLPVLIEGLSSETDLLAQGRLATQAPEVDGVVYINDGPFQPGSIQLVEITEAFDYDLVGRVVEDGDQSGKVSHSNEKVRERADLSMQ
jgi:ribosomal protein S12 methylthiotransferase